MSKWQLVHAAILAYKLDVADEFYCCDPVEFGKAVNGCGTAGWGDIVVPDHLIGVYVTLACMIHDFDYQIGVDAKYKKEADVRFRKNMQRIVEKDSKSFFLKQARKMLAWWYYRAVRTPIGAEAFINKTNREKLLEPCN